MLRWMRPLVSLSICCFIDRVCFEVWRRGPDPTCNRAPSSSWSQIVKIVHFFVSALDDRAAAKRTVGAKLSKTHECTECHNNFASVRAQYAHAQRVHGYRTDFKNSKNLASASFASPSCEYRNNCGTSKCYGKRTPESCNTDTTFCQEVFDLESSLSCRRTYPLKWND